MVKEGNWRVAKFAASQAGSLGLHLLAVCHRCGIQARSLVGWKLRFGPREGGIAVQSLVEWVPRIFPVF